MHKDGEASDVTEGFAWRAASPESRRMDAGRLGAMCEGLAARGTRSLLVARNDRIVGE